MSIQLALTLLCLAAHVWAMAVTLRSALRRKSDAAPLMAFAAVSVSALAFTFHLITVVRAGALWDALLSMSLVLVPLAWALYLCAVIQAAMHLEVKDSQRTLFQFFNTLPMGVLVFSPSGEIIFTNRTARNMLGLSVDGPQTRNAYLARNTFLRGDTGEPLPAGELPSAKALAGKSSHFSDVALERDGRLSHFEIWGEPILDRGGKVRYGLVAFSETTERHEQQRRLRVSEARYRTLVENSPTGIWQIDPDGNTMFLNDTAARLVELDDPADAIGRHFSQFFTAESRARIEAEKELRLLGLSTTYDVEIVGVKGSRLTAMLCGAPVFDDEGRLHSRLAQFIDTTDLKRTEHALDESNERFRVAANMASDFIYECDCTTGTVQWFGQTAEDLGYTGADFPDTLDEWGMRVQPDDRARFSARHEVDAADETGAAVEYRMMLPGRAPAVWSDRAMLIRGAAGRPVKWIGVVTDVTEERLREHERDRLEAELHHAQKMESIGRLAGGIAHDFNNILVVILGYCDMLKQAIAETEPAFADVCEIEKAGKQASTLTSQLLAFSRKQLIAPREVQLDAAVRSMEKMLKRLLGEHIALECRLAEDTGAIMADPGQIEQLIANLAINARDAMTGGGVLRFETSNVQYEESDDLVADRLDLKPGRYVRLTVSDTGAGMDAETVEKIFEPFFTTKEEGKGTGLGLATVYGIVKQAGGAIHVYSEVGSGAVFRIYFPMIARAGHPGRNDAVDGQAAGPQGAGETILIAEDADAPRALVTRILESEGYRVIAAPSPDEALEIVRCHTGTIELLLTDVVMPGMYGPELAAKASLLRPHMKVVFMTGYTDNAVVRQGLLNADVPLLHKPFSARDLAAKIRLVLGPPLRSASSTPS